jgi:zinc protease
VLQGDEKADMLRRAAFNSDLHWRKLYKKAECVAEEKVDGKPAYKVVLTTPEGQTRTNYYDKESGLEVKTTGTAKTQMGDVPVESLVSDYKKVDGILLPHKVQQKMLVQEMVVTLEKVEFNAKLPKDRFDVPDEIKKLVDKEKKDKGGK